MGPIDIRVNAVAAGQFGAVEAGQLRDADVNRSAVRRRVVAGYFRPLLANTYAVGHAAVAPSDDTWRMAAVLEAGPGAALSHETAAERLGIWNRGGATIHVIAPRQHRPSVQSRVVFHRSTRLEDTDIVIAGGIPTTGPARTCRDMATTHTAHQVAHVMYEAAARGMLDVERICNDIDDHPGHRAWSSCARRCGSTSAAPPAPARGARTVSWRSEIMLHSRGLS